jgi:hypothetical protein
MFEHVCERDLVAGTWTDDTDHQALLGTCQALAMAHNEAAREQKRSNNPTGAAQHWARAARVVLWFDGPARVARLELARLELARLELARLDKDLSREPFCNAIAALSPRLWCWTDLPLEALAAANGCERIDRCRPADVSPKPPNFTLQQQLERDRIDRAALEIAGGAACTQVGKDRDALLDALAAGIRGWKTCKARASTGL